jgi:hypothetical protein
MSETPPLTAAARAAEAARHPVRACARGEIREEPVELRCLWRPEHEREQRLRVERCRHDLADERCGGAIVSPLEQSRTPFRFADGRWRQAR